MLPLISLTWKWPPAERPMKPRATSEIHESISICLRLIMPRPKGPQSRPEERRCDVKRSGQKRGGLRRGGGRDRLRSGGRPKQEGPAGEEEVHAGEEVHADGHEGTAARPR
eukprot:7377611-Prymnesium_polylepis.1